MANDRVDKAIIVQIPTADNGYHYVVKTERFGRLFLRGMGAPMAGRVGERGRVTYTTGAGFGLWFWEKDAYDGTGPIPNTLPGTLLSEEDPEEEAARFGLEHGGKPGG